jgi:acetylornithine deacetylase
VTLHKTLEILGRLVAFPSVSLESNLDLIDYVVDLLLEAGFHCDVTIQPEGDRGNVFATVGPDNGGGVILSGHTAVVPVEGQDWSVDPFPLTIRDGRALGRGTTDMKGFIASVLALAPEIAARDLARPVHIALTADEEVGCHGARLMLSALTWPGQPPTSVFIGEPTDLAVIGAHKGCYEYTTIIHGVERHASMSAAGAGAIHAAVRYMALLDRLTDELVRRAPSDSPFDPPASTINVGRFEGGVARNITAGSASFEWELRPVQVSDLAFVLDSVTEFVEEALLPAMQTEFPDASIHTFEVGGVGAFLLEPDSPALHLAARVTGSTEVGAVSFGTEAGVYQEMGIAPVVCGPGSIEQAHRPDESIGLSDLEAGLTVLGRLIDEVSS